jgi:hypothetical protein
MKAELLQWLKDNEGLFFESPRKEAFPTKKTIKGFTISKVDLGKEAVRVRFEGSTSQALPLYFVMFERVLEYLSTNPDIIYPIGARLQPPYPKESIEREIWKEPKPYRSEYKSSPHVLDLLFYAGYIKYAYTKSRDTGKKVQGAYYSRGAPIPTPTGLNEPEPEFIITPATPKREKHRDPPKIRITPVGSKHTRTNTPKETFLVQHKTRIHEWTEKHKDELIDARLNYSWKKNTRTECEQSRNQVSRTIIESRIKNCGALDLEALDAVMKWGFGVPFPDRDIEKVMNLTKKAFSYLDKGDLPQAALTLNKFHRVAIATTSKIIGLYDQENLCIYDSRVGLALQELTYHGKRLIKIPARRKEGSIFDSTTSSGWANSYEKLIWVTEVIRDYMNQQGCTYRLTDVEMALFMMGN